MRSSKSLRRVGETGQRRSRIDLTALSERERRALEAVITQERTRRELTRSFLKFLPHWHYINRETGNTHSFGVCAIDGHDHPYDMWSGQKALADTIVAHPWLYALKAGKLGFTELECAYDGWIARFGGGPNARVHLFSKSGGASSELLRIVRFGLDHLPPYLRPSYLEDESGGKTSSSLRFRVALDDTRAIISYAAGPDVSIDASCQHAHVDELAHMPFARDTYAAIITTISPTGSCHVITRGRGENTYAAQLWRETQTGASKLHPFFAPWHAREGRSAVWYATEAASMPRRDLHRWAPATPEEALAGDDEEEYLPIELFDRCREELPPYLPETAELGVMGVDAGIKSDATGIAVVTRHPDRHEDVAIRAVRAWQPKPGHVVNLDEVESFIKAICLGGCAKGHWAKDRELYASGSAEAPAWLSGCPACYPAEGGAPVMLKAYPIYEVAYDEWQMESVAQRLRAVGINCRPFSQQADRNIADSDLRDLFLNRRIAHSGGELLRSHAENAACVIDRHERKLRMVKKAQDRKIDVLVAVSMATRRCLELYL